MVLTARGIRRWRLDVLLALTAISCATYLFGAMMWLWAEHQGLLEWLHGR